MEHCFAATGQFKGLHDGAGKNEKAKLTAAEVNCHEGTRCRLAKDCYHACCQIMPQPGQLQADEPHAWHMRDANYHDGYFWRYATSDYEDPDLVRNWCVLVDRRLTWDAYVLNGCKLKYCFIGRDGVVGESIEVRPFP